MYLVRHGETEWNKLNRVQGWVDSSLTKEGLEIARLCGLGLQDIAFDAAYSSDLKRAETTAEIILSQNLQKEIPHFTQVNLREISFGSFGGEDKTLYRAACSKVLFGEEDVTLLNEKMQTGEIVPADLINAGFSLDTSNEAEDYGSFKERIREEIEAIFHRAEKEEHEKVLVVSHGLAIFALLKELSRESIQSIHEVKNASVSLLTYKDGTVFIEDVASMEYVSAGKS